MSILLSCYPTLTPIPQTPDLNPVILFQTPIIYVYGYRFQIPSGVQSFYLFPMYTSTLPLPSSLRPAVRPLIERKTQP